MRIICNTYIKKEGEMYSAVCIEFGIASCGYTIEEAYKNVIEAVEIHLNDARELGTLNELLLEAEFNLSEKTTDDVVIQH
ncbi:MAG: type II toxin-antitoxin system HicB family antitoxin [Candidatus Poribacteria bacterium]